MASPVDAARTTSAVGTAGTAHSVLATGPFSAGDLYVAFIRFAAAPGTVTSTGGASVITQLASDTSDASDDQTMIWYRFLDGSETTFSLTTTNSVKSTSIIWRITGASTTIVPEVSTVAIGTTTANTANPASRAVTGGPKDVLYLAMMGKDGSGGVATAAPTNYVSLITRSVTGGAAATQNDVAGASRQIAASSSDDPGVFTHPAANSGWTAWTVVIHPFVLIPPTQLPFVVAPTYWRWL